jgi:hypothetical protein
MNADQFAVLFRHLQMDALPYIPYEDVADTATARHQWVSSTTKRGRRHNEIDLVNSIAMFRQINSTTYDMPEPKEALLQLHTNFLAFLAMFSHSTPLPFHLTDESSLLITSNWPPMIRDIQRYACIQWALESPSYCRPFLVQPGHARFAEVRTNEWMNNPAFRDRSGGCGVVERFALAFYCQFRFDLDNADRQHANICMLEEFILSGAFRVILELMRSYPGNESIQVYLCFFLCTFFFYAKMFLVLRFSPTTNMLAEVLASVRFTQCRHYMTSIKPIVSRNICAAVKRFPYIMKMRHLRYLDTYMTNDDLKTCHWQICDWYDLQ